MKQTLILLHGALGHPLDFKPYTAFLSQHFDIHSIALLGHAHEALPESGISITAFVAQLHQYIENNNIGQCHIFGYSLGGYVALTYALRHPQSIQSILTLATKFDWTEDVAKREVKMLNPQSIREKVPHFARQLADYHGSDKWEKLLNAMEGMLLDLGKNPALNHDNLSTIAKPVQLMVGDNDKMVSIEETLAAARAIPQAGCAILPHTSHPFSSVREGLFLDMVKDFWRNEI